MENSGVIPNSGFEVCLKDGRPHLKWTFGTGQVLYMYIWKAKTDKPYIKCMSNYIGLIYLDEAQKEKLRELLSTRDRKNARSGKNN